LGFNRALEPINEAFDFRDGGEQLFLGNMHSREHKPRGLVRASEKSRLPFINEERGSQFLDVGVCVLCSVTGYRRWMFNPIARKNNLFKYSKIGRPVLKGDLEMLSEMSFVASKPAAILEYRLLQ
jgi:hypothetical protein